MTLTGFAADLRNRDGRVLLRRLLIVAAMLLGAAGGAVLVMRVGPVAGLVLAVVLVAIVCAATWSFGQRAGAWQTRTASR
jgi:uncharacterized membrane protein YoaK (UPF0700 family)